MRDYLIATSEAITASSVDPATVGIWEQWRQDCYRRYVEAMGLAPYLAQPRTPLEVEITQRHERDEYVIECLHYQSLPGLYVAANLYLPKGASRSAAILYCCGHSALQKAANYQAHAQHYARLGFVTLILDTIQLGEIRGYHHGTYGFGWFNWYSKGYSPLAVETWNGIRALDLLTQRSEVDPQRIGVTGNSGGGAAAWAIAATDERVGAASPSCCTGTIASHVGDRTLDNHCDCAFPSNPYGRSLIDFAALIAPRPVLIVSAAGDELFTAHSIYDFAGRLQRVYEQLGHAHALELFTFEGPHSYSPESRRRTFQWFLERLQGEKRQLDEVEDIGRPAESFATLQAFPHRPPPTDRSTTVHDWFIPVAAAPTIYDEADLQLERQRTRAELLRESFATFPQPLPPTRPEVRFGSFDKQGGKRQDFYYLSEPGVRLRGRLESRSATEASDEGKFLAVELLQRDERRAIPTESLVAPLPSSWWRASLSPRGTGDTTWSQAQQWHVRRAAALTGRTLASLRILDVVQGLSALRELLPEERPAIYLAASGEMAMVALYAALLDGDVAGLFLENPPASHNLTGPADGSGDCLELLNCLRISDIPCVAGLLWPMDLVFVGGRPDSYLWAETVYGRLGEPGGCWNVPKLEDWHPPSITRQLSRGAAAKAVRR